MLSLSDLFTPPTADEAFEEMLSKLETLKIPARSWRIGGAYRNILRAVAISYAGLASVVSDFTKAGFLDDATGSWLRLLAHYVYGVDAREATFATGKVLFTNNGGGVYDKLAGTVSVRWTDGSKVYATTEDLHLHGLGAQQLVAVQADELGSASSCAPGQIDALETELLGVEVTNPESVVGSDAQDDDSLRQLCRDKLAALSPLGARGAYDFAVGVAVRLDGSPVDINRHRVLADPTTGIVTVVCASPSGTPVSSDLTAVALSVELNARPDSVTSVVVGAVPVAFNKSLTVWAKAQAGVDAATILSQVLAALVSMVAEYPIGGLKKDPDATVGYLFASNIDGTAKAAHPTIFAVDGVGGDLAINPDGVATLASTVAVRIVA